MEHADYESSLKIFINLIRFMTCRYVTKKLMIGQWGENENLFEYIKQKLTDS